MRIRSFLALSFLVAGWSLPACAQGETQRVVVTFDHPETYTDAALYGERGRDPRMPAMDGIRRHLESLARRLPAGRKLTVDVLDIDLAGRFEPARPLAADVRILRDTDWPRIRLRYTLEDNGVVRSSREETLIDQNFRAHAAFYPPSDPLRYEKAMLDDWFGSRIAGTHAAVH
jgi:hypothetical protein